MTSAPETNGKRDLGILEATVDALSREVGLLRQRQATPWATLISAAGFLVVVFGIIGTMALRPIEQKAGDNSGRLDKIEGSIVPRGEHEGHWVNEAQADANLQRQVDELRATAGQIYTVHDALTDLNKRLDRIEGTKTVTP